MGAAKIPSECLWCERWPVWGYIGVSSAQSSCLLDSVDNKTKIWVTSEFGQARFSDNQVLVKREYCIPIICELKSFSDLIVTISYSQTTLEV